MDPLTEKVIEFQNTNEGLNDLIAEIAPRVYWYPRHKMGMDEEACSEFYSRFQPRLLRLLCRFKDQGRPFESYLCSVLSWQLKNFSRDRRKEELCWDTALRLELPEEMPGIWAEWEEARPEAMDRRMAALLKNAADRRNFLILYLKNIKQIGPERIPELAGVMGIAEQTLGGYVDALRGRMAPREDRLESFRIRRNKAYAQIQFLEREIMEEADPERRIRIQSALRQAGKRMRTAMHRMSRIKCGPTNREIAETLGIPKGTVDSGLFWLKRKLGSVYDPCSRQSA